MFFILFVLLRLRDTTLNFSAVLCVVIIEAKYCTLHIVCGYYYYFWRVTAGCFRFRGVGAAAGVERVNQFQEMLTALAALVRNSGLCERVIVLPMNIKISAIPSLRSRFFIHLSHVGDFGHIAFEWRTFSSFFFGKNTQLNKCSAMSIPV